MIQHLDFIEEHIVHATISQTLPDIGHECFRIAVFPVFQGIKGHADDMVGRNSLFVQIFLKQIEQQIRFSTPADAGNDFDQAISHAVNQPLYIDISFYPHRILH